MLSSIRQCLGELAYKLVAGTDRTGSAASGTVEHAASQPVSEEIARRLQLATDAYREVLDATKHQDDKIGRFLAGIAFLIAGALVFTNSLVLQAKYELGDVVLPLPALALGAFLVLIVLSLLFYVLAMGAPLTIPSPGRRKLRTSHLFFLLIAGETDRSWRSLWAQPEVEQELLDEYIRETRNIAVRVDQKYERSNEASALFILALLFFLLGIVFSIDVLQRLTVPATSSQSVAASANLPWSLNLRAIVGSILALFATTLIYQRLRAEQAQNLDMLVERVRIRSPKGGRFIAMRMRWAKRKWVPLHALLIAYPVFIIVTLLPDGGNTRSNIVLAVLSGSSALLAGVGYLRILRGRGATTGARAGEQSGNRGIALVAAILVWVLGAASIFAILRGKPTEQLFVSLVAAISPLVANLFASSDKLNRRVKGHLEVDTTSS
jgi:hypothetical protein